MKALAISGSPRREGNTWQLVSRCMDRLAEKGIETECVSLSATIIRPCTACGLCAKTKDRTCAIGNDGFAAIFEKMIEADILVVGAPVYFGSATPETMALLDRAGRVGRVNGNLFSRKIGGPIVVARRAGRTFTLSQLLFWYMINDMVVPGSSYWNVAVGRAEGDVRDDAEGLKTVDRFAENLAWLGEKLLA